jgi:hypothetical protein
MVRHSPPDTAQMMDAAPSRTAHPHPPAAVAATERGRRAPARAAGVGLREASALVLSRGMCRPEDAAFMMGRVPRRDGRGALWMVPPITNA